MASLNHCFFFWLLAGLTVVAAVNNTIIKQTGDDLVMNCTTELVVSIKWAFNDDMTTDGVEFVGAGGISTSTLKRTNISTTNAGRYDCFEGDDLLHSFSVTIISITGQNATVTNTTITAELACLVGNDDLEVESIQWKREGELLPNGTDKYKFTYSGNESTVNISSPGTDDDIGLYTCVVTVQGMTEQFLQSFSINKAPNVLRIEKIRSKVEDETAELVCNVTGFPVPQITWQKKLEGQEKFTEVTYDAEKRVSTKANADNIPDAVLVITKLKIKDDRGEYKCIATNFVNSSEATIVLKVKDKLAAVWPFLGICAEVAVLCCIIFIFEKKRSKKMEEEEEVEAVKQDLINNTNGEDKELRQRNTVKS